MTRDRRAALAALCVLGVALAAVLFPAGGFGGYPSGVGTGESPDRSPGSVSDADPPGDAPTETAGSTPTTDGESATATSETPDTTTGTTASETTTATTTAAGAGSGSGGGFVLALVAAVLGVSLGVVAFGFWAGTLAVEDRGAGALPFTATVNGTPLGDLLGAVPARTMGLVVGVSAAIPRLADDAATLTRAIAAGSATVLGALARGTGGALRVGLGGFAAALAAVPRALAGLGAGVGRFSSLGRPSLGRGGRSRPGGPASGDRSTADHDEADTGPPSVEEAWAALSRRVAIPNRRTRTPGEIARTAIDRGYPDEPVQRLTDAFREVRYGGRSRGDRTEIARSALERLRAYWRDER